MDFIYPEFIPPVTYVIRGLSIWKKMNERTVISNIHVPFAWVPGNWQAMWILHPNYFWQHFCLHAHLPLPSVHILTIAPDWPSWLPVCFCIFFFKYSSVSPFSPEILRYLLCMHYPCDLLTCEFFPRVEIARHSSHVHKTVLHPFSCSFMKFPPYTLTKIDGNYVLYHGGGVSKT